MKLLYICITLTALFLSGVNGSNAIHAQFAWEVRDPVDIDFFDLADNKLLIYNGLGTALALLVTRDKGSLDRDNHTYEEVLFNMVKEYNRQGRRTLQSLEIRKGYRLRPCLSTGGGLSIIRGDGNIPGLGINWFFKWHVVHTPGFSLVYDNGVGPNLFSAPFPVGGTRFNFTTHYGLSLIFRIQRTSDLTVKLTNVHISNAGIKGKERNPALDAFGFSIGWSF